MPAPKNAFADAEDDDLPTPAASNVGEGTDEAEAETNTEGEPEAQTEADNSAAEGAEDTRLAEGSEAESDEPEAQETPEDQRKKRTAKERREARKKHLRLLEEQNTLLLNQNQQIIRELAALKGGGLETRINLVDTRLNECLNEIDQAERLYVAAHGANNGADMLAAQKFRDEARARAGSLQAERERLANELTQQRNQPPPQPPVPGGAEIIQHAARFRADKPWIQYGPGNRPLNQETAAATMIDAALKAEGRLNERDPAYWTELDKRVKAAMPHLFSTTEADDDDEEDEADEPQPRQQTRPRPQQAANASRPRGPQVGGSGRNGGVGKGKNIPAEIVAAIKEAGFWDDPKERADQLKYYGY